MELLYKADSLDKTNHLASVLAKHIQPNTVILFYGNIGAGKTTFIQHFINAISTQHQLVTSPTFAIVQSYATKLGEVHHLDLYRINSPEELFNIGIEEILNDTCLIEWSEKLNELTPKECIKIYINIIDNTRVFTLLFSSSYGNSYQEIRHDL